MACFLLYGKDAFLKREFIQELRARQSGDPTAAAINFQEFSGKKNEISAALDFTVTTPFLGQKRLAVLTEVEALSPEGKNLLCASLPKLSTSGILVLLTEESNTKKNAFLSKMALLCQSVACHTPFERDLPKWVERRAQTLGKKIQAEAIGVLLERVGNNLASIARALESLSVYVGSVRDISAQAARDFLGRSAEEDVFRLADLLLAEKTERSIEVLEGLYREGTSAFEILGALSAQCERLKMGLDLKERGYAPGDIAVKLGIHRFYQDRFFGQMECISKSKAEGLLHKLLDCDEAVKTGRIQEKIALETLVLTVTSSRPGN